MDGRRDTNGGEGPDRPGREPPLRGEFQLSSFAAEPIPIEHGLSFDGRAAVEPVTGAEVRVAVTEEIGACPVLFRYGYEQTPASVADIAGTVTDMRRQVLAAKVWLPLGLAAGVVVSLAVGAMVFVRRRPRPIDTPGLEQPPPAPRPDKEERELVTAGRDTR